MQGVTSWLAGNYILIIVVIALLAIVLIPSRWRRFQANRKARNAMMVQTESPNGSPQQAPPVIKPKVKLPNNHIPAPSTPSLDELLKQAVALEVQKQNKPLSDKVEGIEKSLRNFRDSLS